MKPITDDVVFSILKGLEKRERTKISGATRMSDRVLGPIGKRRAITLDIARQAKRTVSGVFCYVAKN